MKKWHKNNPLVMIVAPFLMGLSILLIILVVVLAVFFVINNIATAAFWGYTIGIVLIWLMGWLVLRYDE